MSSPEVASLPEQPLPTDDEIRRGIVVMASQVQWLCMQVDALMKAAMKVPLIRAQMKVN